MLCVACMHAWLDYGKGRTKKESTYINDKAHKWNAIVLFVATSRPRFEREI